MDFCLSGQKIAPTTHTRYLRDSHGSTLILGSTSKNSKAKTK